MSGNRLIGMLVVVFLAATAAAQVNELSVTAGRTFVSTQTIQSLNIPVHFGNEETVAFGYARLLKTVRIFGFSAELPVVIYPRMDLNAPQNVIPKDIGALFVTPSFRVNFFSGESVSPWVSAGGGYGRFRASSDMNFFGSNPGPTGTNTGVVQFGGGLDVWFWQHWGFRAEARDFYSGEAPLNVDTGRSRMHNYYVGAGFLHRF
jgi:hypothetical protein